MNYSVIFTAGARKELHKLDRYTAALILGWIEKNLSGCPNPRAFGKPLVANHQGKWRYRVGNYRLLAQIDDKTITILVVKIAHRREVYK